MKNTWYKAEIIERFMDKRQQEEFDRQYRNSRIINVGRKTVYTGNWKPEWKKYI